MYYLDELLKICTEAELSESQKNLLRNVTDPICEVDDNCSVKELRNILSSLVKHEQCINLTKLVIGKWRREQLDLEPNAYEELTDDVLCG